MIFFPATSPSESRSHPNVGMGETLPLQWRRFWWMLRQGSSRAAALVSLKAGSHISCL